MKKIFPYKQKLIDLFGNYGDASILDYGCGEGDFVNLLLNGKHTPKKIFAVDSDPKMLSNIQQNFVKPINENILITKLVSHPLELQGVKFDKIICQNVLECVDNKLDFINSFAMLLNKGGIFILSHHDFDSAIYNSSYKFLSRELIHHFSDTQQEWQKNSDGQMGRKLPGLISHSVFQRNAQNETWRLVETKFEAGTYGYLMAEMVMEGGKNSFDKKDMQDWYQDLAHKFSIGEYYFAIDLVVSTCSIL